MNPHIRAILAAAKMFTRPRQNANDTILINNHDATQSECAHRLDQIEAGIVERVSGPVTGNREFYIADKPGEGPLGQRQKQSSQLLWRYLLRGHSSCTSGTQT